MDRPVERAKYESLKILENADDERNSPVERVRPMTVKDEVGELKLRSQTQYPRNSKHNMEQWGNRRGFARGVGIRGNMYMVGNTPVFA